jgi:hypothetical protein
VISAIPKECFVKDTAKSMMYAAISTALTLGCGYAAYMCLPMTAAFAPAWLAYGIINGTIATGCWVVAHECGHMAFSDNKVRLSTASYRVACSAPLDRRGSRLDTAFAPTRSPLEGVSRLSESSPISEECAARRCSGRPSTAARSTALCALSQSTDWTDTCKTFLAV